jgi:hypothetical protein
VAHHVAMRDTRFALYAAESDVWLQLAQSSWSKRASCVMAHGHHSTRRHRGSARRVPCVPWYGGAAESAVWRQGAHVRQHLAQGKVSKRQRARCARTDQLCCNASTPQQAKPYWLPRVPCVS